MNDYIRLPRSAIDKIKSAVQRGVLVSLLEKADENGQLTISVRGFADEIGISYQVLRTTFARLSDNAIINATSTQRLTQITLCEFDSYIVPVRKSQRKANATTSAITTQSKQPKFTPPTDEEVATYVAEKGYHFNPAQFVPHYQSKGWKVGNQPMKDWRAACRTWEGSWKEKHGEQFYYEIQPASATRSNAIATQADRYSELEGATETVLRNAPYYLPAADD